MNDKIKKHLSQLEQERQIKILYACETGSRAWGFPSPDSDFDVRLIYQHSKDWYLSLSERKDSIDLMFENNDIDISGWDLRKSLKLLKKSNASLLERIQSPLIYRADAPFLAEVQQLALEAYSRKACLYHYLHLAKNCMDELRGKEQYKLKKFFYALRSATACQWIRQRAEMPPIEFEKMLEGLDIATALLDRIAELIALKAVISEQYLHEGEAELLAFIETNITQAEEAGNHLPAAKFNSEKFNAFFIKMLNS